MSVRTKRTVGLVGFGVGWGKSLFQTFPLLDHERPHIGHARSDPDPTNHAWRERDTLKE